MPISQENFNSSLYDLLKTRGLNPVPKDSKNQRAEFPQKAEVFSFDFIKDGEDYGTVWATIDNVSKLVVYFDDDVANSPSDNTSGTDQSDTWTSLLRHLKSWAQRRQLGFELKNKDHLVTDMMQRNYMKKKEQLGEGYYPMGNKASYNDSIPTVKIILQHNRKIEEGEQRYRNIAKIFVENSQGERFAVPTNRPGIAKVYARHVAEGGTPYDERGKHITSLVEEYSKMAGFVRAVKNGTFNESAQQLVQEGVNHYQGLRETLSRMIGRRGYNTYFEAWTPVLNEESGEDSNLNELFVQETLDPRIESVLPILSKLHKKTSTVSEVAVLSNWADEVISETTGLSLNEIGDPSWKGMSGEDYEDMISRRGSWAPKRRGEPGDRDPGDYSDLSKEVQYEIEAEKRRKEYEKKFTTEKDWQEGTAPNGKDYNLRYIVTSDNPDIIKNELHKFENSHDYYMRKLVDTEIHPGQGIGYYMDKNSWNVPVKPRKQSESKAPSRGASAKKKAVVQTDKPVGYRIADIGPGGREHNVKTNAAWDKAKKGMAEGQQVNEDPLLIKNLTKQLYSFFKQKKLPVTIHTNWDGQVFPGTGQVSSKGEIGSSVAPILILTSKTGDIIAVRYYRETIVDALKAAGNRGAHYRDRAEIIALLNTWSNEIKKIIPDTMEVAFQDEDKFGFYTMWIRMKTTKKGGYVKQGVTEMDKSAPQPGRDGKVSHSTYGSRDKESSDYFKGKESPGKAITAKQASKDALDILKKQGVAEGSSDPTRKVFFKVKNTLGTGMPSGYHRVKKMIPLEDGGFYIELSKPGYGMDYTRHNYKNFSLKDDQGKPITGQEANNIINGKQGMAEGKKSDRYHIVDKDGKPASLASYADKASALKDRDEKYPGAVVQQVGPRGKVKGVAEGTDRDRTVHISKEDWNAFADWMESEGLGISEEDGIKHNDLGDVIELVYPPHDPRANSATSYMYASEWDVRDRKMSESADKFKVGDKVHLGLKSKSGAGMSGTIRKIENGIAHIEVNDPTTKFGPRIVKGKVSNLSMKEESDQITEDAKRDRVSADLHKQGIGSHWRNPQTLVVHDKHRKEVQKYMDKITGGWVHVVGHGEEPMNEETEQQTHLVKVTVSDPSLKSVEPILKQVRVKAGSEEEAIKKAKSYCRKYGFKVHDAYHHSTITTVKKAGQMDEGFKDDLKKLFGVIGVAGAIGYGAWLNHLATYDTELVREITRQAQAGDQQAIKDLRNISLRDGSTIEMDRLLNRYGFRSEHERKTDEGLDADQKRVGQLGPTEKVGPKGAVGKLVGASESIEHDPLMDIKRLL